jgi:hypothetical protein
MPDWYWWMVVVINAGFLAYGVRHTLVAHRRMRRDVEAVVARFDATVDRFNATGWADLASLRADTDDEPKE